jgi:hypothetical protein
MKVVSTKVSGEGETIRTEDEDTVTDIDSGVVVRDGLGFPVGSVLLEPPGARIKDKVALLTAFLVAIRFRSVI